MACTLGACLASTGFSQSASDIAETTVPSVVVIIAQDAKGKSVSLGSGFFVREDLIATNNHVIAGASRLYAKFIGQKELYRVERVVATDMRRDLALIKIKGITAPALQTGDGSEVKYASLEDNEIADRLIELVLNASREAISERHLHCLAIS